MGGSCNKRMTFLSEIDLYIRIINNVQIDTVYEKSIR